MLAGEATAASAGWLAARVLQADTLVVAIAETHVRAHSSGAVVSGFALALEVTSFRYEQAVRVRITVHLLAARLARIRAVCLARLPTEGRLLHRCFDTILFMKSHHPPRNYPSLSFPR